MSSELFAASCLKLVVSVSLPTSKFSVAWFVTDRLVLLEAFYDVLFSPVRLARFFLQNAEVVFYLLLDTFFDGLPSNCEFLGLVGSERNRFD